jgi:predicted nucleotidyltransferase
MAVDLDEVKADALRALGALKRHTPVAAAVLFGSQVEGSASEDSDIDLAVFIEGAERWDLRQRVRLSCRVQREAGDRVELHIFPAAALKHCEPASFAAYVLRHGVKVDLEG